MMGRLSCLMFILVITVLCVLPSHCELKTEESLDFNMMDEIDDGPESMRIKRKQQINDVQDDPLFKLRKGKQTQKSIKQKVDDIKTTKRENNVMKLQSGDSKHRSLDAVSGHQSRRKSGQKQISKFVNKKSVVLRKVRNCRRKSVNKREIEKDGTCVDDKQTVDKMKINHSLEKRSKGRKGKSGMKNKKSVKRDVKLDTLNEIKPLARKIDVGTPYNLEKKNPNTTFPVNLSKNTQNGVDDDDETCGDEHGALKVK